ncbi:MAG: hypothetical protein PUK13_03855, partial [Clostridiales bacterium]|nr:hypothetical protein [Clostridiales bacterium]
FLRKWQFLPSGKNWRLPGSILFEEWTFKVAIHSSFQKARKLIAIQSLLLYNYRVRPVKGWTIREEKT